MNWKYEAIDKLRDLEAKRESLHNIPKEIELLESSFQNIRSATTDGTLVTGGGSGREDAMLNNIVKRDELKLAYQQTKEWVDIVQTALDKLGDDERLVLERFYINPHRGSVERLCDELFIERATAYRHRDRALRKFTLSLYGVMET